MVEVIYHQYTICHDLSHTNWEPSTGQRLINREKPHEKAIETNFGARPDPVARTVIGRMIHTTKICTVTRIVTHPIKKQLI